MNISILISTISIAAILVGGCSPDGTVVTTIITAASASDGDDDGATDGASASTTDAAPTTSGATTTTTGTDGTDSEASTYGFDATDSSSSSTTGEPPPGACGEPGSLFGPCIDGLGCLGNFGCFSRQAGQVCIPTFNWAATHSDEIQACVRQIGGNLICGSDVIIEGWCVVSCGGGSCAPGINCDDGDDQVAGDSVCVHPW